MCPCNNTVCAAAITFFFSVGADHHRRHPKKPAKARRALFLQNGETMGEILSITDHSSTSYVFDYSMLYLERRRLIED